MHTENTVNNVTELNTKQKEALEAMLAGRNVFLTGAGGVGKSVVISEFVNTTDREVVLCAPTGIAATHIEGITVHRLIKPPFGPVAKYTKPVEDNEPMQVVNTIIVDEISMLRSDMFWYLSRTIRHYERQRNCKIQLIVVGDFFQLPPVISKTGDGLAFRKIWNETGSGFAFNSFEWKTWDFHVVCLTEQMRQDNEELIQNLNKMRIGDASCIDFFNTRTAREPNDGITLCPTRACAKEINERAMLELLGHGRNYKAIIEGDFQDEMKPTEDNILLKEGARVMTLRNDTSNRYQNGSLGTVVALNHDSVKIAFDNGVTAVVWYESWQNYDYVVSDEGELEKKEIGGFSQLPIMLAYAITIHKSQGQTFNKVNIKPRCFAPGQLYVACSRVKTLEGLYIDGYIREEYIKVSKEVVGFYDEVLDGVDCDDSQEHYLSDDISNIADCAEGKKIA